MSNSSTCPCRIPQHARVEFPNMPVFARVRTAYAYSTPEAYAVIEEANDLANQRVDTCDDDVIIPLVPPPRPPRNHDRVLPGIHRLPFSFPVNRNHTSAFKSLLSPFVIGDDAHLMRISGMWSYMQPFEVLYNHAFVHWLQRMPITIRIFPPMFAPKHNAQITHMIEMEMMLLKRTLKTGHFEDHKRLLSKDISRELISGHWRPFTLGHIWTIQVRISCWTQDGRRIKLIPFFTGPRSPGDKMPTLEEELIEHQLHVDRFTTVRVLNFSKSIRLANSSPLLDPVRCKIDV
ncbi:hypothetical protein BGZ92_002246 [Podila epicladia]|nr:hypothetical protein BGZ92_002246 [Podila epicladia]